jgi:hypothetical protein
MSVRGFLLALAACLSACGVSQEQDKSKIFVEWFGEMAVPGVEVVNGFQAAHREGLVESRTVLLQLRGPAVVELLKRRWPDLQPQAHRGVQFMLQPDRETAWFKPAGRAYQHWESPADGRMHFHQDRESGDFYLMMLDGP